MTRIRFQKSLDELKENLLVMAGLAEQAIQRAIEAYRVRDLSICDLVSRSENAINRMERDIDQAIEPEAHHEEGKEGAQQQHVRSLTSRREDPYLDSSTDVATSTPHASL